MDDLNLLFTRQSEYMKKLNTLVSKSKLEQKSSQKTLQEIIKNESYDYLQHNVEDDKTIANKYQNFQNNQNNQNYGAIINNENVTGYSKLNATTQIKNIVQPFALKEFQNGIYYGQENTRGELQGEGAFLWNDGDFYYGQWNDSKLEGLGIFVFAFGGVIEGNFVKGRLDGLSRTQLINRIVYTGYWKQGVQHGCAKIELPNGQSHNLIFVNGQELYMEQVKNNYIFTQTEMEEQEGMVKNADHNYFKKILSTTILYNQEHNFVRMFSPCLTQPSHFKQGVGVTIFPDLRIDCGFYLNEMLDGKGRICFNTGDIYDGYFSNGKFKGSGVYYNHSEKKSTYGTFDGSEIISIKQQYQGFPPPSLCI